MARARWSAIFRTTSTRRMIKKHLSRGGQLRRFGGLAGTTDSGNRGHATSDNKTNIRVAIFPNPWAFEFSRNVAAADTRSPRTRLSNPPVARYPLLRKRTMNITHLSRSAIARIITRDANNGSAAHPQKCRSNAGIRDRGPRDRSSVLERRLHDGPRPQRVRRADVGLRQQRCSRATKKRILTCNRSAQMTSVREKTGTRIVFNPEASSRSWDS
jgi:hypothetical protein